MALRLNGITEGELAGELLVNTPYSWSIGQSRKALEEMVLLDGIWSDLNPASVYVALSHLNFRLYGPTPEGKALAAAFRERRRAEARQKGIPL